MLPTHLEIGKKNGLYPKVFGQSGTAMPAPWLVTRPPKQMSTSVAAAVNAANRARRGLSVDRVMDSKSSKFHRLKKQTAVEILTTAASFEEEEQQRDPAAYFFSSIVKSA